MRLRMVAVLIAALASAWLAVAPAAALECHSKPVKARGGPGLVEATAKSRARSAWIKKVHYGKRLGKDYAAWLRASNPGYSCRKHGKRFVCEASAVPCRLESRPPAR